ncbi:MAG: SF1B family DNA helicase RecD2 [Fimbriiglobus sp.]
MADVVTGAVERITFHNLDNGYCVLKVRAKGHRDLVTVVGNIPQVIAGEYLEATGDWTQDRFHGIQFTASELKTTPPHSPEGIIKYLGSGLVKGIGPTYAKKIVEVFGEKTLDVIDQSPTFLNQIKGIGPKRIELIRSGWQEHKHVHRIMAFLASHGIGTARAVRIYKTYGENAIEQVRTNPYRLSTDIWGIGFRTADQLALELGIPRDSPHRAQAAVRHVLQDSASNGHVGLPEAIVVEETMKLTQIPTNIITQAIEDLRITDELVRDSGERITGEEGSTETLLFLKPFFLAEVGVARSIHALQAGVHPLPTTNSDEAVAWVEKTMGIQFATRQREAVLRAMTEKLLVLTGGPGTGKTTIVKAILEIFRAKQQRVGLCAPTGRAAKRLAESTGGEAKTIHRLLEFDASLGNFRKNKENPLDLDLLVVDEVSMADMVLMNQLLRAIPPWASVVLVGDRDQLPSVGPGSVLNDLIASERVAVVRLDQIHRQAGSSWIVRAAHAVNQGDMPESAPAGGAGDFYFVETEDENKVVEKIIEMVRTRIPARFGLDAINDVQVLAPMNKAVVGVQNLNKELQAALNPGNGKDEVSRFGLTFRPGDKVIQTQNNYQREVFNGDIGRVLNIDSIEQVLTVNFEGRAVDYEFSDLDELQLAYAISIHKSQGSEYPAVIIPVHTQHWIMMQRNLIYTGITRGKKLVVLVGNKKALNRAVNQGHTAQRFSLLRWRLQTQIDITVFGKNN